MKHSFSRAALFGAALSLAAAQLSSAADITVDLNTTYQTIDGFGGMQDRGWTGYNLTTADRNLLYGTGPGQIGLTIMRIRLNESQSNWSADLVDAKDAVARGMKLFATAWSPPTNLRVASGSSYKIDPSNYQGYVDHLNAFAKYMKDNNAPLYALGFQNEPDWCSEWGCGTTTEMYNFAKNYGAKLRQNGNQVITAESFSFNKGYYDAILNDATALANIDILGTHFYGTSKTSSDATFDYTLFKQKGAGHHFWMTEVYTADVNNNTSNTWPLCLDAAYEIHRAMALSNMSAYVWWYLKRHYGPLYSPSGSESSQGTVSKIGYIMGQYSKFVRPGAVRIGATRVAQTDVYTAAFKHNDSIVIVSVNRASSSKTVAYSITGIKATSGAKITTSGTKGLTDDGTVTISGGNFSTTLDAQSISTIVIVEKLVGVTPKHGLAANAPAGTYTVYDVSGALLGKLEHAQDQGLAAEVRNVATKPGLYFLKAREGAESYTVALEGISK